MRHHYRAGMLAVVAGVAVLTAACGGPSGSAGGGSTAAAGGSTNYQQAVAFAQCMRAHGVPDFPDPSTLGGHIGFQMPPSLGPAAGQKQQFQAAQNTCEHLYPNIGQGPSQAQRQQMQPKLLNYAKCMRSHGVPDFPDPNGSGFIPSGSGGPQGVDTASPQYQSAHQACRSLVAGLPAKATGSGPGGGS